MPCPEANKTSGSLGIIRHPCAADCKTRLDIKNPNSDMLPNAKCCSNRFGSKASLSRLLDQPPRIIKMLALADGCPRHHPQCRSRWLTRGIIRRDIVHPLANPQIKNHCASSWLVHTLSIKDHQDRVDNCLHGAGRLHTSFIYDSILDILRKILNTK